MNSIKDQLISLNPPQPREVWIVNDSDVRLHSENRQLKKGRPVLIVSSEKLTKPQCSLINIIPLTTSKMPDKLIFPVFRSYEELHEEYKPKEGSTALIQFYQPIETKYFVKKCGKIDATSYNAIQYILCTEVIGYCDFDLSN